MNIIRIKLKSVCHGLSKNEVCPRKGKDAKKVVNYSKINFERNFIHCFLIDMFSSITYAYYLYFN